VYTQGLKIGPWRIEGVYFNTAGSFALSYIIGLMFSAEGLTVLFGGILSTGMSQAYFSAEGFCNDQGWSFKSAGATGRRMVGRTRSIKARGSMIYSDFRQPILDIITMMKWFVRIITFPFTLARRSSAAYTRRKMAA